MFVRSAVVAAALSVLRSFVRSPLPPFSALAEAAGVDAGGTGAASDDREPPFDFDGLFRWVRSHPDAVVSDLQEYRRQDPSDEHSPYGMFASTDIPEGTVLLRAPSERIMHRGRQYLLGDSPDLAGITCATVRKLWYEWEYHFYYYDPEDANMTQSYYGPYLEYLRYALSAKGDGSSYTIPSAWSDAGKDLLMDWLDQVDLPSKGMLSWINEEWDYYCRKLDTPVSREDEISVVAAVVQQHEDDNMVPLSNLYTHRNFIPRKGHFQWTNADPVTDEDGTYKVISTRDILAGEEIHVSYTECRACGDRRDVYGVFELFRDYGFVERYPQHWVFKEDNIDFDIDFIPSQDDDQSSEGRYVVVWMPDQNPDENDINVLRKKLMALELFGNMEWQSSTRNSQIPKKELDVFWELHQATTTAIREAIKYLVDRNNSDLASRTQHELEQLYCFGGLVKSFAIRSNGRQEIVRSCQISDTYVDFSRLNGIDLSHNSPTCNNFVELMFLDHEFTEVRQTHYQKMTFDYNNKTDNVCFDLDGTLQICDNYRPQYHEYAVHYPAQYLDTVERVLFIGGGDSMLLHEILKYKTLKQVIGLELDQQVTRKSFKYFETQPQFDDPRVEWWFGDATKSLLLLPTEYYTDGYFDLVLVDLSETVTALTVTSELDVIGALALLVKPDGIMVKNEVYFNKLSKFFDYTAQIFYESPTLCGQSMAMGSNRIDFFHHKTKQHDVGTLLMKPFSDLSDRMEFMQDYGLNKYDPLNEGLCSSSSSSPSIPWEEAANSADATDQDAEPETHLAMYVIADVENVEVRDPASVGELIVDVGNTLGLSFIRKLSDVPTLVVFEEAYVSVMGWPDHKYCALDVHMWGSYDKMQAFRDALIVALTGDPATTQTYRVIVGGLYGNPAIDAEHRLLGPPRRLPPSTCKDFSRSETYPAPDVLEAEEGTETTSLSVILEELPSMLSASKNLSTVFCGPVEKEDRCEALSVLRHADPLSIVIPVYTCDGLVDVTEMRTSNPTSETLDAVATMYRCEGRTRRLLEDAIRQNGVRFSQIVIDASVSFPMAKVAFNALRSRWSRQSVVDSNALIVSVQSNTEDAWRAGFVPSLRLAYRWHPMFSAHLLVKDKAETGFVNSVSILSVGDMRFPEKLVTAESVINTRLMDTTGDKVQILRLRGGVERFKEDFDPPRYNHSHYDYRPAREQFKTQVPLGRQTIFQVDTEIRPSLDRLKMALDFAAQAVGYTQAHTASQTSRLGDGSILMAYYGEAHAVVIWGGRLHVDLVLFSSNQDEKLATEFGTKFVAALPKARLGLRDDQPRGVGHVINFQVDINGNVSNADNKDTAVVVNSD